MDALRPSPSILNQLLNIYLKSKPAIQMMNANNLEVRWKINTTSLGKFLTQCESVRKFLAGYKISGQNDEKIVLFDLRALLHFIHFFETSSSEFQFANIEFLKYAFPTTSSFEDSLRG